MDAVQQAGLLRVVDVGRGQEIGGAADEPQAGNARFHDHVLDSMPTTKGYSPIWHVYLVFPAYTGVTAADQAINVEYAKHLPATSESAVVNLLATTTVFNGTTYPVAQIIDTGVFFLCAVVSPHAVH